MEARFVVGVSVDEWAQTVRAVVVHAAGLGLECRFECAAAAATAAASMRDSTEPDAAPRAAAACGTARDTDPFSRADQIAETVRAVVDRAKVSKDQLLAIGILGDSLAPDESTDLRMATRVVELTGITAVTGFAERDRAAGGRGKPLGGLVDWLLASDRRLARGVVHIDGITSFTSLPASGSPSTVMHFETGPGAVLLEHLAAAFSRDRLPLDTRGVLAVQGRQIKPLVRRWATHPFLRQDEPKQLDPSAFGEPFIRETVELAVERGWSVADVLCTATHFVAACPADAVRQFLSHTNRLDEVVLVGRGVQNGFLLRLIEDQFMALGVKTAAIARLVPESYEAVTAAVLACLTLDGVPSNLPSLTGAAGPRRLGSLIAGTPLNWRECVEWMHAAITPAIARAA